MVNKKFFIITVCMFLFFYTLNYLTPLSFGDDYVYSFIWEGHSLYEPLSENAVRLSSWKDLLVSQLLHYYTWSGRIVNHTLEQFFLWTGKSLFNICNTFVSIFLMMEIYWFSNKGDVTLQMNASRFCGIFFALWAFTPKFGDVFLWLVGACNYLWPIVLLLSFLLPYVRKYYLLPDIMPKRGIFCVVIFFLGLLAGCTNENTICFVIPVLILFIFRVWKNGNSESWLHFGLAGLIAGYVLLMFAPGNIVRLLAEKNSLNWLSWDNIKVNIALLVLLLVYYQIIPWYYNLRALYSLGERIEKIAESEKDRLLAKVLCAASFFMTFVMIFSPGFPPRSAFPGTVLLIIAAFILLRIQGECSIILIKERTKKFLRAAGIVYFVITAIATFYGSYYTHQHSQELLSFIKASDYAKSNIIEVNSLHPASDMVQTASWFHVMNTEMSDNEKDWRNVAFSRYYGIKGIRMVKGNTETNK